MRLPLASLALALTLVSTLAASAKSGAVGCDAFLEKLRADAADLQVEFSHAVVVSRARADSNTFDITTKSEVDGTLICRGDQMARFEAHIAQPASARAGTGFEKLQIAALRAALGWDAGKSGKTVKSMAADAKEYYAASRERGDVYVSGKTEEHAPGGISLGLIYTDVDRAFLIVGAD